MKKIGSVLFRLFITIAMTLTVNFYILSKAFPHQDITMAIAIIATLTAQIFPGIENRFLLSRRLRICADGCELLKLFLSSSVLSVLFIFYCWFFQPQPAFFSFTAKTWAVHILLLILMEAGIFWNGMIRIYCTSAQLGIKWRIIAALTGMIPIVNLIVLRKMLRIVSKEAVFENDKLLLNASRKDAKTCETKYPLLLVHGVFFRDFRFFNYWGRIPGELTGNGATVFYGKQQSAASVSECGREIADRILEIVKETGCEKVNVIAHSKGGLDTRYALSLPGISKHVASLSTINTPHRGCEFADFLLHKIGEKEQNALARVYNSALKKVGDPNPDFLKAVYDLTSANCEAFNQNIPNADGVYYQSFGSKLNVARGGRFPLNMTHSFVKYFDGANDGLVGEASFPWGENFQFITVKGTRGISHGDMIDLNRENFDEFDVREFYVQLVADLKKRGF